MNHRELKNLKGSERGNIQCPRPLHPGVDNQRVSARVVPEPRYLYMDIPRIRHAIGCTVSIWGVGASTSRTGAPWSSFHQAKPDRGRIG